MKVLKFGAVWCNGCLVMRPRWEEIEKENPWLVTEYYDFDEDKGMVERYKVEMGRLPVFVFLDERGEEILRLSGEVEKEKLVETIEQNKEK
jgi:thiol-disulfide isomerase/thioredoxin